MKRPGNNLDVKTIDALQKRDTVYRVSDGAGLLLEVKTTGAKVWICRLTIDGKRRDMGLGGYPTITLKAAREAARGARVMAFSGVDPIVARAEATKARIAAREAEAATLAAARAEDARVFKVVAEAFIKSQVPGWKNARTAGIWRGAFERHVYPTLGAKPIAAIDRAAVLEAIGTVWATRPGIAKKVLQRIGMVLRYAAALGMRANDNPADVRMLRHAGLPALAGGRKQPSVPWQKISSFMSALDTTTGFAPLALRFTILTAVRSGEVRGARWSEISFDGGAVWSVPGERMKGKKTADVQPHRVPLSDAAVLVLARAYAAATGAEVAPKDLARRAVMMRDALVFPSAKQNTPLSDMSLSAVVRRMNEGRPEGVPAPWRDNDGREAVPHGFRATFRTWVDDTCPGEAEAAERALAPEDRSKSSGAYRRSDMLDRRVPLMRAWAEHCAGAASKSDQNGKKEA